jgi:hypothetical protein
VIVELSFDLKSHSLLSLLVKQLPSLPQIAVNLIKHPTNPACLSPKQCKIDTTTRNFVFIACLSSKAYRSRLTTSHTAHRLLSPTLHMLITRLVKRSIIFMVYFRCWGFACTRSSSTTLQFPQMPRRGREISSMDAKGHRWDRILIRLVRFTSLSSITSFEPSRSFRYRNHPPTLR